MLRSAVSSVTVLVTIAGHVQRSPTLLLVGRSHKTGNKMRCSINFRVLFFSNDPATGVHYLAGSQPPDGIVVGKREPMALRPGPIGDHSWDGRECSPLDW